MTPPPGSTPAPEFDLQEAIGQLTAQADQRWVEVSDRVLASVMQAVRPGDTVRVVAPSGPAFVSETVLISYLRATIDGQVSGSAVAGVHIMIAQGNLYDGVLIELIAQYGRGLLDIADQVREIATATLTQLLGDQAPPVTVKPVHIHYSDVVIHDPDGDSNSDPSTS